VSEIIGNAPIDRDWLNTHARRAADMIAECDAARTMWVHPYDLPLIDSNLISLTLMADPEAERGSIRIDCSTGWIEHGTALYLDELRTELGLGGHGKLTQPFVSSEVETRTRSACNTSLDFARDERECKNAPPKGHGA
jgi:hypothetical protein